MRRKRAIPGLNMGVGFGSESFSQFSFDFFAAFMAAHDSKSRMPSLPRTAYGPEPLIAGAFGYRNRAIAW